MSEAFSHCESLKIAPEIPNSVINMNWAFQYCLSMSGNMVINANPKQYTECFYAVNFEGQNLTLTGTLTMIEELKATGK